MHVNRVDYPTAKSLALVGGCPKLLAHRSPLGLLAWLLAEKIAATPNQEFCCLLHDLSRGANNTQTRFSAARQELRRGALIFHDGVK